MKQNYLNAVYTKLILEKDYQPVYLEDGTPLVEPEFKVLTRSLSKVEKIVELIDGDVFSTEGIMDRLSASPDLSSEELAKKPLHHFIVLVFDSTPPPEKAEAIHEAAARPVPFERIVLMVNLAEKKVISPGKSRFKTFPAIGLFRKLLDTDLSEYQAVPDPDYLAAIRRRDYTIQFQTGKPLVTYVLVGLNIAVFLALRIFALRKGISYDSTLEMGAKVNALIMAGQYWRLFSAMFVHANELHLAVNCYSLYVLGTIMERIYGHAKYTLIYFGAGLIGSIASFALSPQDSVGASGAIVGLFGALLYFGVERPNLFRKYFQSGVITTLILNFIIFVVTPGLDNYGHLGGLVGGFLTAGAVRVKAKPGDWRQRVFLLLLTVILGIGGLYFGFVNRTNQLVFLDLINKQIRAKKISANHVEQKLESMLQVGLKGNRLKISALANIIWAEAAQKKYREGIAHANALVKLQPLYGHYWLGILYYYSNQYPLARQELLQAERLSPGNSVVRKILDEVNRY